MDHSDITCVILCGGQGKRMQSADRHKVCFPIAGEPAIVRTVGMLKSVGLSRFLIVVGQMAEQVIATVASRHPEVGFVYQAQPRGTGHAAACAAEFLKALGGGGRVLVTMGDKVIQPNVVADLIERQERTGADMVLTTLPKTERTTAGRVVTDERGRPVAIVELADIRRAAKSRRRIGVGGRRLTAAQVESRSRTVNASLYLFRAETFFDALGYLGDDNAQGELYLTDTVAHVSAAGGKVALLEVGDEEDVMAFNTPEELLAVEQVVRRRLARRPRIAAAKVKIAGGAFRTAEAWMRVFEKNPPSLRRALTSIYGPDAELLDERRKAFQSVLKTFLRLHGPKRRVVLARAPGRINLMGRHVDHRGGYVNVMAISREVVLAAAPREDDAVTLANVRGREFPRRSFRIGELLRSADWFDWMDYLNSTTVRQVLEASRGDWSNYAKAAVLRLQHACPDHRLRGMDCVVAGNIPMGAGLSSSSAVVVGVAEAAVALNGLDVTTRQFVDLCGEGEWFVGSRGGSADHAAIRTGERGKVARVGFFPFRIEGMIPFPAELSLIIANSHIRAAKSAGARDTFNQRVACYNIAEILLRQRNPILRSMEHLRDVNPEALQVLPAEIYRLMKTLPRQVRRRSVARLLGEEHKARVAELLSTHADVGPYRLRDVAMFGISECRRSDMFAALLRKGQVEKVGELMRISHDGDRIVRHSDGWPTPHEPSYADARLDRLAAEAAPLWAQSGWYACSTPEIDFMVDLACRQEGVIGAQVAGAGLGGCAMILVRTEALDGVLSALRKGYYRLRRLPFDVHVCRPVAGSGILKV